MPFIDCRTTQQLTEAQKEAVKAKLGRAIAVLHKPESYLMVGFADETLYFAGKKLEKGPTSRSACSGRRPPRTTSA